MDPVNHPLDWWASGGYDDVMHQTGWSRARARREGRKVITFCGPEPCGHAVPTALRRQIMNGELHDNALR